jgi:O-antigen ligase
VTLWAVGLWLAMMAGIVTAWSPRYWAVSVAIASVSVLAICWTIASGFARDRAPWPRQTALVVPIGAWGFLQIAFHTTLLPESTLENSLLWAIGAAAFVVGARILRDREARRLFLELLLWSSTALAVIAMVQFYSTPVLVFGIFPGIDTVTGTFLSRNQFAAFMELAAPVAMWYMLERNMLAGGLCYAMILAAGITAGSRAGVVLLGAEMLVFLAMLLAARRREAKAVGAVLAGLALLAGVAAAIAGTDQIRARFDEKNPYEVRRQLFDSTLKLIAERPVIGYGMGTWRAVYPRAATFDSALLANEAHNDWAQWACDGGIPFALLMAGLTIWIARPAVLSIWGMGVLSVMLHSYVDYPIREPALAFLWFTMAGAVSQFERGKTVGETEDSPR